MNVWRIGSKWGSKDILPIFKEHKICFCGEEAKVERLKNQVKKNDIVAITDGQAILGVGKVSKITSLENIDEQLVKVYDNIPALEFDEIYFSESKQSFGNYGGQGKEFHQAGNEYADYIKSIFFEQHKKQQQKQQMQKYINLLKQKHQVIFYKCNFFFS
jgi:hypothetical protein